MIWYDMICYVCVCHSPSTWPDLFWFCTDGLLHWWPWLFCLFLASCRRPQQQQGRQQAPHHSFGHDCSLLQKVCPAKIQQQNANVQELPAHVLMSRKSQQLVMSPLLNSLGQVQLQRRRALKQNSSPVSTIVRCDARRCDVRKQAPPTNGSLVSVRSMRYLWSLNSAHTFLHWDHWSYWTEAPGK